MAERKTFVYTGALSESQEKALRAMGFKLVSVQDRLAAKRLVQSLPGTVVFAESSVRIVKDKGDGLGSLPEGFEPPLIQCSWDCEIDPDNNQPSFTGQVTIAELQHYKDPSTGEYHFPAENSGTGMSVLKDSRGTEVGYLLMIREDGDNRDLFFWDGNPWPDRFRIQHPNDWEDPVDGYASPLVFQHATFGSYLSPPPAPAHHWTINKSGQTVFAHLQIATEGGQPVAYWWASPTALTEGLLRLEAGDEWLLRPALSAPPTWWRALKVRTA